MEMITFDTPKGGEAIIIRNKKQAILIDGGEGESDENKILGGKLREFLINNNAKLRAIILSHNHEDHSNAIGSMVDGDNSILEDDVVFYHQNEARADKFYTKMVDKLDRVEIKKIPIDPWEQKRINNWDGDQPIKLFCGPKITGKNRFYRSILALVPFGNAKFLFTGDIETKPTENKLIADKRTKPLLKNIDVLKITHHGSGSGTGAKFLNFTSAALFVTSSAADSHHDLDPKTGARIKDYIKGKGYSFNKKSGPCGIFNTCFKGKIIVRTDGVTTTLNGVKGVLFEVETEK